MNFDSGVVTDEVGDKGLGIIKKKRIYEKKYVKLKYCIFRLYIV